MQVPNSKVGSRFFAGSRGAFAHVPQVGQARGALSRDKMVAANDRSDNERFDLKLGRGGMVDIEFLVQYYVLRWAHKFEQLIEPRGNLEILAKLAESGVLDEHRQQVLAEAYQSYLATDHRLKLSEQPALVPASELAQVRNSVQEIWRSELGD